MNQIGPRHLQFGTMSLFHAMVMCAAFSFGACRAEAYESLFVFALIPIYCGVIAWKADHDGLTLIMWFLCSVGLISAGAALWALDCAIWSDFRLDNG